MKTSTMRALALIGLFMYMVNSQAGELNQSDKSTTYNQAELKMLAPVVENFNMPKNMFVVWETVDHPERKDWSQYTYSVINKYLSQLDAARDLYRFCPNYLSLNREEKIIVWGDIFAGISKHESGWNPADQSVEAEQGLDSITHSPVYSEGLLQLSYQDKESNPYCAFNWKIDRQLPLGDLHRTILNPYNNLYCGIRIMADLVSQNKKIIVSKDGYWSTLQEGSPHQQIREIFHFVQTAPFCKLP